MIETTSPIPCYGDDIRHAVLYTYKYEGVGDTLKKVYKIQCDLVASIDENASQDYYRRLI